MTFGRAKNRKKVLTRAMLRNFGAGFRWSPPSWGENLREGKTRFHKTCWKGPVEKNFADRTRVEECSLARRCHTYGGRRIEDPPGGTPPPTHFVRSRPSTLRTASEEQRSRQASCDSTSSWQVLGPNDQKHTKILKKSIRDPPKSRPGASKIEPGALQDAIF